MKKSALILFFILSSVLLYAQPGGGFGGNHPPMGPPPGGNGGKPSMSERERMRKEFQQRQAQQKSMEVRQKKNVHEGDLFKVVGTLQDSTTGEGVPYVNLAIYSAADSSMVKGGITDMNGYFELQNVPQGDMFLRISAIGYQNLVYPFTVSNNTALGTLRLKQGSTTLEAVKVVATRPLYSMEGEKMIYNVAEDPTIQTGTTSDALQNAPGVEVDIEGNITLRGVSSVEVWVNDKPSKLTADNLKTYLETLPANALDRIETITNPSAKYATDADAVINIITSAYIKSNHLIAFGVNGASQPNVSPWLSYTWANEKLSVNVYGSARYSRGIGKGNSTTTGRKDGEEAGTYDTTFIEHYENESRSDNFGGNLFANINYNIDSMTTIEFMGHGNYNQSPNTNYLMRSREDFDDLSRYLYVDTNDNSGKNFFGMAAIDFTHKFDNEGHNIRASIHEHYSNSKGDNSFIRLYSTPDNTYTIGTNYDKLYQDRNNTNDINADIRYNLPYSSDGEFSFGLGYDYKNTWRDYNVYDSVHTNRQSDLLRTYSFRDKEHSVEGDVEWTRRWGGFTLELGLGSQYENVNFQYIGSSKYPFTNQDSILNYFTLSPSVHLSYSTRSMHNFKLNYSLRVRHPEEYDVTTYKRYTLDSWSMGNPSVTNSYTHNAEIGWNKYFMTFGNIGVEGYARFSTNEISNLTSSTEEADPILDRFVQYTIPYNMGSSYRVGGTLFTTIRPSGFFNIRLYVNLYDYGYTFQLPEKDFYLSNHKVSWSARLNCWVKLWDRLQVFASANYSSPTISLAAERDARYNINCGVRADFFKRKLSAFINVQDIFNWGATVGSGSSNTNPYLLSQSNSYTVNSRYISAGITFRFGKLELENRAKQGTESSSLE